MNANEGDTSLDSHDAERPAQQGQARDGASSLQHLRQLESLGQLATGMSHDLNNLLTSVLAHLDLLEDRLEQLEPERIHRELQRLRRDTLTGSQIVKHLLSFSRSDRLQTRPMELSEVVGDGLDRVRPALAPDISLEFETNEVGPVLGDRQAVERIVMSLVANAQDAMPNGGRISVDVGPGTLKPEDTAQAGWGIPGDYGVITITDRGRGIPQETIARLFKPFFDLSEGRNDAGQGLTLAMIYGLMKQQRGFIQVDSDPGAGTWVRLYFRLQEKRATPTIGDLEPQGPERGTVLFVEDDHNLLRLGCKILAANGYRPIPATDGRDALTVVEEHGLPDLIIADLVMPNVSGVELLRELDQRKELPGVLLTSALRPEFLVGWHQDPSSFPFLGKPWTVEEFLKAVDDLTQAAQSE